MTAPKLGYLCLSENPSHEAGRALIRQFVLVREAERMGYDDIWLAEHHFDGQWPHAGALALLGQLMAVTTKSRVGSLALLPAVHDPLMLASHVATLDLMSKGRFQFGVASGGALSQTLKAYGLDRDTARSRMHTHLDQVLAMLSGQSPRSHDGHEGDATLALSVQPVQPQVPIWLAADDDASLQRAGREGWGLVAAATHTKDRVRRAVDTYMKASNGTVPQLTLARFASTAASTEEAVATATSYFDAFISHATEAGWGQDPQRSMARDMKALLAESLVGQHKEVAAQFKAMAEGFGATRIAIVPTSGQFDTHKHILADFVDEIRPLLDED
jgi:alkanesulfonate monooxygenase SsuD/methylene tetrahydromethanopterin reductase-like flavin-dependent oxidoreductase (luciferase family)